MSIAYCSDFWKTLQNSVEQLQFYRMVCEVRLPWLPLSPWSSIEHSCAHLCLANIAFSHFAFDMTLDEFLLFVLFSVFSRAGRAYGVAGQKLSVCVCLCVNQSDPHHNRCTHRPTELHPLGSPPPPPICMFYSLRLPLLNPKSCLRTPNVLVAVSREISLSWLATIDEVENEMPPTEKWHPGRALYWHDEAGM